MINLVFYNTLFAFALCVFVSDMQQCDINTTLSIFSCALIYTDKLIVITVNDLISLEAHTNLLHD